MAIFFIYFYFIEMCDTLVLDMAAKTTDSTECFTRKDWLSILDNQNQSYTGNQCVCDTSQFANSNKWINYREGYFTMPLLLTLTGAVGTEFTPNLAEQSCDWKFGLKNWYGSIIHSFALEYNGTMICQQVPFSGMWNTFKLMTSLSLDDVKTQGSLIGFYPDTAGPVGFSNAVTSFNGQGTNNNVVTPLIGGTLLLTGTSSLGQDPANMGVNVGLYNRIQAWNFDLDGLANNDAVPLTYATSGLASATGFNAVWQSYIFNKTPSNAGLTTAGVWQANILAIVYLKHLHSFFESVPLLKGAYLKMTLNLNQSSVNFTMANPATGLITTNTAVTSPLGGVSPLMICGNFNNEEDGTIPSGNYIYSVSVGNRCLNAAQSVLEGVSIAPIGGGSVTLNVPAYTFNPVYEQSYISTPIKKIVYTDIYQYQTTNQITGQAAGGVFNILVSNGIANIKSVLVLPFFSQGSSTAASTNGNMGLLPFQSPYDPAGAGPTSPLIQLTQFNVQISGQNAIYNTQKYTYEQFANQFKGVNAVNGGQTDGLASGLIGYKDWIQEYCYYYVNCGRMLPAEEAVPKSVYVVGINMSPKPIDLYIFVEYGVEISVDLTSGARV